jgi:predicted dienelactone hydrolase
MWSLETSKCQGPPQLAKLTVPALVVQGVADMGVFPSDARKIFGSIAATDKTLELVPGAHYFEESEANRERAIDLMASWISERT